MRQPRADPATWPASAANEISAPWPRITFGEPRQGERMSSPPGDIMEGMTDSELISRAEALGVSASYVNWRRERAGVPAETLRAIVSALGDRPAGLSPAGQRPRAADRTRSSAPNWLPELPEQRSWGFTVQLYSVRSRRSWGHGDLHDLADLARWSGRRLGAGFILINPLHAPEPTLPVSNSPYLPMTRRYI